MKRRRNWSVISILVLFCVAVGVSFGWGVEFSNENTCSAWRNNAEDALKAAFTKVTSGYSGLWIWNDKVSTNKIVGSELAGTVEDYEVPHCSSWGCCNSRDYNAVSIGRQTIIEDQVYNLRIYGAPRGGSHWTDGYIELPSGWILENVKGAVGHIADGAGYDIQDQRFVFHCGLNYNGCVCSDCGRTDIDLLLVRDGYKYFEDDGVACFFDFAQGKDDLSGYDHQLIFSKTQAGTVKDIPIYHFNGSNSCIYTAESMALRPEQMTIEVIVSSDGWRGRNTFAMQRYNVSNNESWLFAYDAEKHLLYARFMVDDGNEVSLHSISADVVLLENQPYHLAVTFDGSQSRIFVNYQQIAVAAMTGEIAYARADTIFFGRDTQSRGAVDYFYGDLMKIRIAKHALTTNDFIDGVKADIAILPLSPDPNPEVSKVMAGGDLYRYYRVVENATGELLSGRSVEVSAAGQKWSFLSDDNGIVTIVLAADYLGKPGDLVNCTVTTEEAADIAFNVKILPRKSVSCYSFGSGISIGAGAGVGVKMGSNRGLVYEVLNNTDADPNTDDPVQVSRKLDLSAGVKVSSPIGIKMPGLKANAEASLCALYTGSNTYLFPDPYSPEEEALRAGLILTSFFQGVNLGMPLINIMIDYIVDHSNNLYSQYRVESEHGLGAVLEAGASLGAGFGFDDKSGNKALAIGGGVVVDGNLQMLLRMLASYSYDGEESQIDEMGAGIAIKSEFDLFADAKIGSDGDVIGSKVKLGIGGSVAGSFSITLFCDSANRWRCEFAFSGNKSWGVDIQGISVDPQGSTDTVILTLEHEQVVTLAEQLANLAILCAYLNAEPAPAKLNMGPTRLKNDFVTLFSTLNNMPIGYRREREIGQALSFSPGFKLALGVNVELGVNLEIEKSVSYLVSQGIVLGVLGDYYPEVRYDNDEYIPAYSPDFDQIIEDCAGSVFAAMKKAGKIVLETAKKVGSIVITPVRYLGNLVHGGTGSERALYSSDTGGEFTRDRTASLLSRKAGDFGINGAYGFSPEGTSVSEVCASLSAPVTVNNGPATLAFSPGATTALLTATYSDADVASLDENDLKLFVWQESNHVWAELSGVVVDTAHNRISAPISVLGTFAIGLPLPQGEIEVAMTPPDIEAGRSAAVQVVGSSIAYGSGKTVADGTLVTVDVKARYGADDTSYGTITTADADPSRDGIQVATVAGRVEFSFTPPAVAGAGTVIIQSVDGNAAGYRDFNIVDSLDSDDNGLPDFWENTYFHNLGQDPGADPDRDGLNNLEEYEQQTNPLKCDTDGDGMDDGWEVENGLNPKLDDAGGDIDRDGVTNKAEYDAEETLFYVSRDGHSGGNTHRYSSIGAAYAAATCACREIRITSDTFIESPDLDKELNLLVSGGWNDDFNKIDGESVIDGCLNISRGCLQIERITLGSR